MPKPTWTDEQFVAAVRDSASIAEVLRRLKLSPFGDNYKTIHRHARRLGLSTAHFTGMGHLKGKTHNWAPKLPLDVVLVERSPYACRSSLKRRLIKEGVLEYKCSECGIWTWQGKPLSLQLEHRNGVNDDNRRENLCLLCPNCHSQTDTFAGRNK